jgi:hypothetical protein
MDVAAGSNGHVHRLVPGGLPLLLVKADAGGEHGVEHAAVRCL